ncbi:Small-conductance mechanosensitive channel [Ectothiorhodospira magna]|uniref:Small-conductance mechanosensitive channel n=1 Tax=Ectothiorhodospira magna TaxID=867345 RepID=A0A1H9FNH6_9GAMM|nr:mechanosensitive ion channel domain-containing protein [Ectothiorhodospira magna]SEQ39540.1 Small-conductance mechanosensitive channel [Ectothiorhodospira magna]
MDSSPELTRLLNTLDRTAMLELALILIAAVTLIIVSQRLLPWLANRLHGTLRHHALALVPVVRLTVILGALILALPVIIEPSLQNMVAILGAAGLAIGFALKDYASSLIAGVVSAFEQPYRPGDWIELDGHYGEVVHVGMRTVALVTADDDYVTVPHLKLWSSAVRNANNGSPTLQCTASFHVHPEHDATRARAALEDVAMTSPYLSFDNPVIVAVREETWGTKYIIRAYPVDPRQQFRFVTDLTVRGRAALTHIGARAPLPPAAAFSPASQPTP